jgi:hypothetical protein
MDNLPVYAKIDGYDNYFVGTNGTVLSTRGGNSIADRVGSQPRVPGGVPK